MLEANLHLLGNVLHDWPQDERITLIRQAYEALPPGEVLIAIENVIDADRGHNVFELLMSLNMLVETPGGSDYAGAEFDAWARSAGFTRTEVRLLTGPTSAAIAYRS
ncbi:MAG TPA: methyltransferase [Ilumatobacteraceae bacterium]|nr:methyltransferase [Ilumatobacteraceae bacterium]